MTFGRDAAFWTWDDTPTPRKFFRYSSFYRLSHPSGSVTFQHATLDDPSTGWPFQYVRAIYFDKPTRVYSLHSTAGNVDVGSRDRRFQGDIFENVIEAGGCWRFMKTPDHVTTFTEKPLKGKGVRLGHAQSAQAAWFGRGSYSWGEHLSRIRSRQASTRPLSYKASFGIRTLPWFNPIRRNFITRRDGGKKRLLLPFNQKSDRSTRVFDCQAKRLALNLASRKGIWAAGSIPKEPYSAKLRQGFSHYRANGGRDLESCSWTARVWQLWTSTYNVRRFNGLTHSSIM